MAEIKVSVSSPDPVLARTPYTEAAPARIAHVNEAMRLLKEEIAAVGKLPAYTAISGQSSVAGLPAATNAKLLEITNKLNALITALS